VHLPGCPPACCISWNEGVYLKRQPYRPLETLRRLDLKARIATLAKPLRVLIPTEDGPSKPMRKGLLPGARRHDPLAGSDLPLLNFLKWMAILGTLVFGSMTIWFFVAAHRGHSVGFLVAAVLFGVVWRVTTQRLKVPN
jgi:hypothetical protein